MVNFTSNIVLGGGAGLKILTVKIKFSFCNENLKFTSRYKSTSLQCNWLINVVVWMHCERICWEITNYAAFSLLRAKKEEKNEKSEVSETVSTRARKVQSWNFT